MSRKKIQDKNHIFMSPEEYKKFRLSGYGGKYLDGKRDNAIIDIAVDYKTNDTKQIVSILKQSILDKISVVNNEYNSNIHIKGEAYRLMNNFKAKKFFDKKWKYTPFYITQSDYDYMQACVKFPIYVERYKFDSPVYEFANKDLIDRSSGKSNNSIKDIKFFMANDEKTIFAKTIEFKNVPKSFKLVNESSKNGYDNIKKDQEAPGIKRFYDRSLSISMYVLLNGDPNKAMSIVRYDNQVRQHAHQNIWIGFDKKKEIFSETAHSPHFHFQNENDSILCLRHGNLKNDFSYSFKTGRSNAIDCTNLRNYLIRLDKINGKLLKEEDKYYGTLGMPFLNMKKQNYVIDIDLDSLVEEYYTTNNIKNKTIIKEIRTWLKDAKLNYDYDMSKNLNKCFGNLIKALDFLNFITKCQDVTRRKGDDKILSDMEIIVADRVINAICRNRNNYLTRSDNRPTYKIDFEGDSDEKDIE